MKRFGVLILLVTIFTGCAKKSKQRLTYQDRLKIKVQAAKLSDIPIPLGANPEVKYITENSFGYTVDSDIDKDMIHYYQVEMEHYGWRQISVFDSFEKQLIFEKPHKLASITIRDLAKQRLIIILTSDKK